LKLSNHPFWHRSCLIASIIAISVFTLAAKPKPKPGKEAPAAPPAQASIAELPEDLNLASLRVHAIDVMYEFGFSPEQLKMLLEAASGAASDRKLSPAVGNDKLTAAFKDFNKALLTRQDDQEIAKLRNQLTELATADDAKLDDEVEPTKAARAKSPDVFRHFTAGQIAAFLASHADQISDPVEKMVMVLTELRDGGNASEADAQIQEASDEIGRLIAGSDDKKCAAVTAGVNDWFKAKRELTDEQIVSNHAALEASAKKVVGDVPPMEILTHWMENETATLLSNPQLPQAIDAVLAAQER
jgi:hypothetical protein